ncbi:MAG TPA: hypothetical protein VH392_04595 [Sphingomicrobium sp.]|jgi:hypothetical protein
MYKATGFPIGIAIGVALGVALHNIGLGIAIGTALGIAFSGYQCRQKPGENADRR